MAVFKEVYKELSFFLYFFIMRLFYFYLPCYNQLLIILFDV